MKVKDHLIQPMKLISEKITCCATGEANDAEILRLWWLLGHDISTNQNHMQLVKSDFKNINK